MSITSIEPKAAEFLREALGTNDFDVIPLAGDASTRRYFRVVHGCHSYVLMAWEPFTDDGSYPFLSVQKHFLKHSVHVPKIVRVMANLGLVLLEDLGDLTLERKFWETQDHQLVLPFYKQAIDELIKIHYASTSDPTHDCTAFNIQFDRDKFVWEMNYGRQHLIEKLAQLKLSPSESRQLDDIFDDIARTLDEEPKYISHRDYHSRNLMIKLGKMRVIDFQDARLGPVQYDLVSLVHDSYVDLDKSLTDEIVNDYVNKAQSFLGSRIDREHFDHIFNVQIVQRGFKACGSFASFYNLRHDKRYLKYINKTLRKVVQCLEFFPQYQGFAEILSAKELINRDFSQII